MFDFLIAGIQAPIFLLVLTGFTVGIVGGFIGVGGGYMVTPALIVFGFPGYMASGIDVMHIAGKATVATIRHRQLGNIDWTLALAMVGGTMMGIEMGVRLLNHTKALGLSEIALLTGSLVIMIGLFLYTQVETHRSHKKIKQLTEEGKTVGRELTISRMPLFLSEHQSAPHHPLSCGPGRHLHVGDRCCRYTHRSACRVLRRRGRLHSSAGPCLPSRGYYSYCRGNGPGGDRRFGRLWGYAAVHER